MPRRTTSSELEQLIAKRKYGIDPAFKSGAVKSAFGRSRPIDDVESAPESGVEGPKSLQVSYTGKVRVSIKFYRHRLADYSRAISEKALIDCLQYAGLIHGDSEKEIWLIDEGQEKVGSKAEERTEITLEYDDVDYGELWAATGRTDGR